MKVASTDQQWRFCIELEKKSFGSRLKLGFVSKYEGFESSYWLMIGKLKWIFVIIVRV